MGKIRTFEVGQRKSSTGVRHVSILFDAASSLDLSSNSSTHDCAAGFVVLKRRYASLHG